MKQKSPFNLKTALFISFMIMLISTIVFTYYFFKVINNAKGNTSIEHLEKTYHIMILGNNENELFLKEVYEGAKNYSALYNALIELYVPKSHAEDTSTQALIEYASFVNADGIIVYINDSEESLKSVSRIDDTVIPIVTIGQFAPNTNQISYVGTSYWELGRLFGNEIIKMATPYQQILIQNPSNTTNTNYSNLTNSILSTIKNSNSTSSQDYSVYNEINEQLLKESSSESVLLAGLTEEDTIHLAQLASEAKTKKSITILGYGNNETCQTYLSKGTISELISQNPRKVGEAAIKELFEYRNKGYANNYVVAEATVKRSQK